MAIGWVRLSVLLLNMQANRALGSNIVGLTNPANHRPVQL